MIKKRFIIVILITLSMTVWSYNFYRIVKGVQSEDMDSMDDLSYMSQIESDTLIIDLQMNDKPYIFQDKHRDPFLHWLRNQTSAVPKVAVEVAIF